MSALSKIKLSGGGETYLAPHTCLRKGKKPKGIKLLSGYILDDPADINEVVRPEELNDLENAQILRNDFVLTTQKGDDSKEELRWLRVSHSEYANMMNQVGPVKSEETRITPSYVYLANEDADSFLKKMDDFGLDYSITNKSSKNSSINRYPQFDQDKLLVSYYKNRRYYDKESGDIATIQDVHKAGLRVRVAFKVERGDKVYQGIRPLEMFFMDYSPVNEQVSGASTSDKQGSDNDLQRFITTGQHIVTPDPSKEKDQRYINAVKIAIEEALGRGRSEQRADDDQAPSMN